MKIKDLLSVLPKNQNVVTRPASIKGPGIEVTDLTADSRQVQEGSVFVAIRGTQFDGHSVLGSVCAKNPTAVVVEDESLVPKSYLGTVAVVANSRRALAHLAARYFGDPSVHFFCFGVTGTNGKTSCTYLMEHLLGKMNLPTGVIGTIEHKLGEKVWPTSATTPGPIELQSRLSEMRSAGARAIAMEVSSHALDQSRADAVHFNAVLFTNLTRDHLDYHGTEEKYFAAKQRLFTDLLWETKKGPLVAAVNGDDPSGRRLKVAFPAEIFTFGRGADVDFRFEVLEMSFRETKFRLQTPFGELTSTVPLCGVHNLYNVVGCVVAATALGIVPKLSLRALETFNGVPGRLQAVQNNRGVHVFVDYAHSPDALENVLKTLQDVRKQDSSAGKVILVFGCGGDRDKGKRPLMATVAEKYADVIIVTSDNPRTEDPLQIIREIQAGFTTGPRTAIADRREAIVSAIKQAQSGDVVLIAGKGHEDYQVIGTEKIQFSDYGTARGCFT